MNMKTLWPSIAIIIAIILAFACTFQVSQGQSAILLQYGKIEHANYKPGLYFKLPFVQQVAYFDTRIQTLDGQPERYFTEKKKSVNVNFYVKWRIDNLVTYYKATTGNINQAQERLAPIIKDALRFQVNSRTLEQLISGNRQAIRKNVITKANKAAEGLGIKVLDMRIQRIAFPTSVRASVYSRMRAERKQLANNLRSTGKEKGETIRAAADRKRTVLLANANSKAAKVKGEGNAEAAAIYAKAYSKDPQFFDFFRSLKAYRQSFGHGKSVLIVNPHSRFMRYFSNPDGHTGH